MTTSFSLTLAAILIASPSAPTWAAADATNAPTQAATAQDSADMTDGEVRKVDMDAKKITLKHGELKNLGMPSMTMVFQVKDPTMLDRVKTGDKVRFTAEKVNGALTVTNLEAAK